LEKRSEKVPMIGKIAKKVSNGWKNGFEKFQRLENRR
jgi:hypothetical protein